MSLVPIRNKRILAFSAERNQRVCLAAIRNERTPPTLSLGRAQYVLEVQRYLAHKNPPPP